MTCCTYHNTLAEIWYKRAWHVKREQVLSEVIVLSYKASHTLHIYCLDIAAFLLAVTLQ